MDKGLITQLQILKLSNIKPNFSELARLYDLDRRTVKRYYDGYEGKPKHHNKSSRLDEHYDLIKTKLSLRGANVRAVYEYIKDEVDSGIGTYSNFCKPRHAFTKGKVEALNKFLAWLIPYEGEFETEEELIAILSKINKKVCERICDETGVPPIVLFQKEKEYLQSLPSEKVLESYLTHDRQTTVRKDSMVTYMKNKYYIVVSYPALLNKAAYQQPITPAPYISNLIV